MEHYYYYDFVFVLLKLLHDNFVSDYEDDDDDYADYADDVVVQLMTYLRKIKTDRDNMLIIIYLHIANLLNIEYILPITPQWILLYD